MRSDIMTANTMAFATLTLSQLFHAFDVRSEDRALLKIGLTSNPAMNKAFLIGAAMQLAVLCVPPFMAIFSVTAMTPAQWWVVILLSLLPALFCEGWKNLKK